MLVIGTYRDSDVARDHSLTSFLADMRREPNVARVALRGLDDAEILALMEGVAGYEMQEDGIALAHALYQETDGNPFFAGEVFRHLYETGAIALDEHGHYVLTIDLDEVGLPGSVREVVRRRVDRLGEETTRLLSVAAVVGHEFDLDVVAAVAEVDEDDLLEQLEAATNAALVVELASAVGRFRFDHALIQHTLYQDLDRDPPPAAAPADRAGARGPRRQPRAAGRRAGPALARGHSAGRLGQGDGVPPRLRARRPSPRSRPKTRSAGSRRRSSSRSARPPTTSKPRCDLLIGLGDAQQRAGVPAHRETVLEAAALAEQLDDCDRLARAALASCTRDDHDGRRPRASSRPRGGACSRGPREHHGRATPGGARQRHRSRSVGAGQ